MLIDSHCHLSSESILPELDQVISRARTAGVTYILNAGGKFDELDQQIEISNRYGSIFTLSGVHPHDAFMYQNIHHEDVLKNTKLPQVVGIGECGLDYFYDFSPRDVQIKIFKEMIKAAQESGLPLVVHTREAEDDTAEILREAYLKKPFKGEIHCYSSSWKVAQTALEIGFYISASGIITFKKSEDIRQNFAKIPLDRLLVETDSPYLAPVPWRGKVNEPAYVVKTAEMLAQIKEVDFEKISDITSKNFFDLFTKARETTWEK